jgi:E3 ubiquitin-protein ligase RNF13
MQWSATHNLFNRGEKCAVCLEDFQLGNALRVMECLHRYHLDCLDQWLTVRATCPSCRTAPQRQRM